MEILNRVCRRGARRGTGDLALFVAIAEMDQAHHGLSYEKMRTVYEAARSKGYTAVSRLFLSHSPERLPEDTAAISGHHQMQGLTLGERKSLARGRDIAILEKLLLDPDPHVIANLLRNPRITEREVLYIATRRPNRPEVIEQITLNDRWISRYRVRLGVARNPYAPPSIAMRSLMGLSAQDLGEIRSDETLHLSVRMTADDLLERKRRRSLKIVGGKDAPIAPADEGYRIDLGEPFDGTRGEDR